MNIDKELIARVIKSLRNHPDQWSLEWFGKGTLSASIMHISNKVQIMIETGTIIRPQEIKPSKEDAMIIIQLIKDIGEEQRRRTITNAIESL